MQDLIDRLRVIPQYLIPQHFLSYLVYHLTRSEIVWLKNFIIIVFKTYYRVDTYKAAEQNPFKYPSFNQFFTRALNQLDIINDTDDRLILSPVEGTLSQLGTIDNNLMFQAKNRSYQCDELLALDKDHGIHQINNGFYMTFYLSPRDYHRVHIPLDGTLLQMTYVPGDLFAVNRHSTRVVNKLFTRNERVICKFENQQCMYYLVMVGALFVGNIETVWAGEINTEKKNNVERYDYNKTDSRYSFNRGEEIGRFNMGSTVILIVPNKTADFSDLTVNQSIGVGKQLARIGH